MIAGTPRAFLFALLALLALALSPAAIFADALWHGTAANATLVANSGANGATGAAINFLDQSTGSATRVEVFGDGALDISSHSAGTQALAALQTPIPEPASLSLLLLAVIPLVRRCRA